MNAFWTWALVIPALVLGTGQNLAASPGKIVPLPTGALYLPEGWDREETVPAWIHLHGDPATVRSAFRKAGLPGVLVTHGVAGLSSAYAREFEDPNVWPALLQAVEEAIRREGNRGLRLGTVTLSSFSAGYGGIRTILRQTGGTGIDRILLADSLYAGFAGDREERRINPVHLAPFLAFAQKAAMGEKQFFLTCSEVPTPSYASTRETALAIVEAAEGSPVEESVEVAPGWIRVFHFQKKGLRVEGYAGETGEDHLRHLRLLHLLMAAAEEASPHFLR